MPAAFFFASLELEQKSSFMDEHELHGLPARRYVFSKRGQDLKP
jgi:hypothetical protein